MKQIFLVLTLIYLAACEDYPNDNGPANNVEYRPYGLCEDYYVYNGTGWLDDSEKTVSDCVDLNLYSKAKGRYYDKCCFVRFQKDGEMHSGCIGLFRDSIIDITETIKRMENGDKNIWTSEGINSKIYDLDCKASYISVFAIAFTLFSLLF
jgi:hypothetical protein